jgi:hypothetical protein
MQRVASGYLYIGPNINKINVLMISQHNVPHNHCLFPVHKHTSMLWLILLIILNKRIHRIWSFNCVPLTAPLRGGYLTLQMITLKQLALANIYGILKSKTLTKVYAGKYPYKNVTGLNIFNLATCIYRMNR